MNPQTQRVTESTAACSAIPCLFATVLGVLAMGGCAVDRAPIARIHHVVLVTLQDRDDRDRLIRESDAELRSIPGVVAYAAGPMLDLGRDNTDTSFDVGILIGFDTAASYRAYVTHPAHVALVDRWKPRIRSLRVHDFTDRPD